MTATEKVLAAKGASSLEALAAQGERTESAPAKSQSASAPRRDGPDGYLARFGAFAADADRIEAALTAAGVDFMKERSRRPDAHDSEVDEIRAYDQMEAYVAVLKTKASLSSVKLSMSPSTVSSDWISRGIVSSPAASNSITRGAGSVEAAPSSEVVQAAITVLKQVSKKPTATERLLAARGVSSLEELAKVRATEREAARRKRQGLACFIAALFLALSVFSGNAQFPGTLTLLSGGTNKIAGLATNAAIVFATDEYPDFGLQASGSGQSGNPSNIVFWIYRSLDSETHETEPFTNLTLRLSGTTTNVAVAAINASGAATIKIVPANTNATAVSNLFLKARFKAPKRRISGS